VQPDGPPPSPDILGPVIENVTRLVDDIRSAGVWVFDGGLHEPSTATVVRVRDGDVLLTDGPYAEAKEHIGGLLVIEVEDLDAALMWARRAAEATTLPIEVRPFVDEVPG
jgi:hypothetical protein